jgi:hypothetical protein
MARFYGSLQGNRGEATRMGTARSGLSTYTAGWDGAVRVVIEDRDGVDYVTVQLTKWQGSGTYRLLYEGPVNGASR